MTPVTRSERKLRIKALHVRLERTGRKVRMRIIKQAFDRRHNIIFYNNGNIKIGACSYPELDEDRVWLRGADKNLDNAVTKIEFANVTKAKDYFTTVKSSFQVLGIRYE